MSHHFQDDPQAKKLEPDRAAMLRELNTVLDEEISQLSSKYREPLLLHLFDGIERQEMAQRLGVSTGAITGCDDCGFLGGAEYMPSWNR